ncbi:MAG: chorismate mutase [Fusobacteria bacterium]|nr:chorismate mutase [Fusobacteriota bacterium]
MKDLNYYREEIEKIDCEMAKLFESRLLISKEIAKIKHLEGREITDKEREIQLLEKNSAHVDRMYHGYYQEFYHTVLRQCKKYQKSIWDNLKK